MGERDALSAPPTILVVDHDAEGREAVRFVLENEGFTVIEASDGKEALEFLVSLRSVEPALILTELQMPTMTGLELVAILKSYHRLSRIPVLVHSATAPEPDLQARGTIAAFIAKPCKDEQLLAMVRGCLARVWATPQGPRQRD